MAIKRKWMPSPCYHSRGGIKPTKIVLHTAEGARTIESLGNFFANGSNQVSSQTGADDQKGVIGEYVTRGNAAWTQAAYNEESVALELCGFASWSRSVWLNDHEQMVRNAAAWVAEEAAHYGIPIVALNNSQAQGSGRGVCQHINFGSGGGGHVDCGSGFPMDKLIEWAKGGGGSAAADEEGEGEDVFYLEFKRTLSTDPATGALVETLNNDSSLSFTNDQADGKHKVRFSCRNDHHIRVDQNAGGPTKEGDISYDVTWAYDIAAGSKGAVVHVDSGDLAEPIAVSIGKQ